MGALQGHFVIGGVYLGRSGQRLGCELRIRDGNVVYDLNKRSSEMWDKLAAPDKK